MICRLEWILAAFIFVSESAWFQLISVPHSKSVVDSWRNLREVGVSWQEWLWWVLFGPSCPQSGMRWTVNSLHFAEASARYMTRMSEKATRKRERSSRQQEGTRTSMKYWKTQTPLDDHGMDHQVKSVGLDSSKHKRRGTEGRRIIAQLAPHLTWLQTAEVHVGKRWLSNLSQVKEEMALFELCLSLLR